MSDPDRPDSAESTDRAAEEAARRRQVAEVFGDVLPDITSDERDPEGDGGRSGSTRDDWYREQVPPHHG